MDIYTVENFFMWCSIINGFILVLCFLIFVLMGDFVYRMHSRLFPISKEAFNIIFYSFIGLYKMLFWVFNLVPFLAAAIVSP